MKRKQIIIWILICVCVLSGVAVFVYLGLFGTLGIYSSKNTELGVFTPNELVRTHFLKDLEMEPVTNSVYEEEAVSAMNMIAENDYLEMYFDEIETKIAVRDKKSGALWFSNPVNEEEDLVSSTYYQQILKSQLYLTYIDKDTKISTMNNYTSSIESGQFEIEYLDDGVKITYFIADEALSIRLPEAISVERMEEFLSMMTEDQQKKLKRNYTLYSLESLDEEKKEELLAKYPVIEDEDLYILRSGTKDYMREELSAYFENVGYTQEDYDLDCQNLAEGNVTEEAWFKVPITYQLDNDTLTATVNPAEVTYNTEFYYLVNIDVLRYFGASLYDDGYMFVPDGSGALINFNNGKTTEASYSASVYGQDSTMIYTSWYQSQVDATNTVKMPVYGIKDGDKALFAIIEEGDAYATIKAEIGGALTAYNDVYSSFAYLQYGEASLDDMVGAETYYMYSDEEAARNYKIRYSFLTGKYANYSGMSACYRNYLLDTGVLSETLNEEELPFYVEYIGAIDKPDTLLGIKYDSMETLTTYKQAETITSQLLDSGISNLNVIYSGCTEGGLHGNAITGFDTESKLESGGEAMSDIQEYMKTAGIDFFMTLDFQYVYEDTLTDGYSEIKYAPRYFDNTVIKINHYGMASRVSEGTLSSLISPYYVNIIADKISPKLVKEDITGVNIGSLSYELYSDFNDDKYTDRQIAEEENRKAMQTLSEADLKIVGDNANAYIWQYASDLINVPMSSNNYRIIDEEVPFYEMVLHGYVSYAGEALSLADDYETALLKSVECGAGLNFMWIYESNSLLKETEFDYLYSVNYENWIEWACSDYSRLNDELGYLQGYEIVSHEYVQEDVAKVVYADGSSVYVNYTNADVAVDSILVPARDYKVEREAS